MPANEGFFIPTLNRYGYMLAKPDEYSQLFIDYAHEQSGFMLDVGAAYGVASIPALAKGAHVIANDLDERHLSILWNRTPVRYRPRLMLKLGKFPSDVSFPPGSFDAILASGVLHYLPGEELEIAFKLIFKLLKKNAKFFFCTSTPYINLFKDFLPIYEKRKKEKLKWPGLIENCWVYAPHRKNQIPKFINLLDEDILVPIFADIGFQVEQKSYVSMMGYPPDIQSQGREYVGFVLSKP